MIGLDIVGFLMGGISTLFSFKAAIAFKRENYLFCAVSWCLCAAAMLGVASLSFRDFVKYFS